MFNTNARNVDQKHTAQQDQAVVVTASGALGNYELIGAYPYIYHQNFDAGGGAYSAHDYYIEAYAASDLIKNQTNMERPKRW